MSISEQRERVPTDRALSALVAALTMLICALSPAQSSAQETIEPTEEQRALNNEAVVALGDGEYTRAISLLEQSLYMGEMDIIYLNLGRAYQLAGRCEKAEETLQKVADAPASAGVPDGFVADKTGQYLTEVRESCEQAEAEDAAEVAEANQGEVGVKLEPDPVERDEASGGRQTIGYVLTGAGVAAGGTALVLTLMASSVEADAVDQASSTDPVSPSDITQREFVEERERYEALQTGALSTAIVGGALIGTGVYLLLTDDAAESEPRVGLQTGGGGLGLSLSGSF